MIGRWLGRLGSPPKLIVTVPSSPAWAVTLLTDLRDVDAEGADRADRDRPVAGPVPDVHQRRGRGEPVADHRLDGLTDGHGCDVADRHQIVDDTADVQTPAEGGDDRQGAQHLSLPLRD